MGGVAAAAKRAVGMQKEEMGFLMVGLDAAGKTTILYKMCRSEVETTIPTIGFIVESVEFAASKSLVSFTAWDVGGRSSMRPLWRHWYSKTSALVFVIDSSDKDRLEAARDQLDRMLDEDELSGKPLLVFANKQDLAGALSTAQIVEALGLHRLRRRMWYIQASTATTGEGLREGIEWLSAVVSKGRAVCESVDTKAKLGADVSRDLAVEQQSVDARHSKSFDLPAYREASSVGVIAKGFDDEESAADTESTADTEHLGEPVPPTEHRLSTA